MSKHIATSLLVSQGHCDTFGKLNAKKTSKPGNILMGLNLTIYKLHSLNCIV